MGLDAFEGLFLHALQTFSANGVGVANLACDAEVQNIKLSAAAQSTEQELKIASNPVRLVPKTDFIEKLPSYMAGFNHKKTSLAMTSKFLEPDLAFYVRKVLRRHAAVGMQKKMLGARAQNIYVRMFGHILGHGPRMAVDKAVVV